MMLIKTKSRKFSGKEIKNIKITRNKRIFLNFLSISILCTSVLSILLHFAFAQSKVDSLKNLLISVKHDTATIIILNALSVEYINLSDYDKAMRYSDKALVLCSKLAKIGKYDKTILLKAKANFYNNKGLIHWRKGNFDNAIEFYYLSLKINEQLVDKKGIAISYNNIGGVFYYKGDYEKTIDFFLNAIKLFEELGDQQRICALKNNIGIIYFHKGNYDKAFEYYDKALSIKEKIGQANDIHYANMLNNIGIIYKAKADYNKSLEFCFKSIKIREELEDKEGLAAAYNFIGGVYIKQGKIEEGKKQLLHSLAIALDIGIKPHIINTYLYLSYCDSFSSNWKGAYQYHKLYSEIKDSVFNEESSKQIVEMQTKYETEKKEQQIKLLEKEGELQKSEVRRQKFIIWSVAGGLLIVVVFSFFIFKERRKSEKLLLNILPVETARELKKKGKALPKHYELVTVLFTDFKGFTKIAEKMSVEELVSELDFIFRKFDEIISKYPIEKIKTIGDAYMCAGGLPVANTTNPMDVVLAALDIQQFVEDYKQQCIKEGKLFFEIRIGVHSGPVVAGVVGDKKFAYDIWGDTVNTASRMESSGVPGHVNISGDTYKLLRSEEHYSALQFTFRGKIPAKNKGDVEMYFVVKK